MTSAVAVDRTPHTAGGIDPLWPRLARARLAEPFVDDAPVRLVVIGPAGAGKSWFLRRLAAMLRGSGHAVAAPRRDGVGESRRSDGVLMVDDAHLLGADGLAGLAELAGDPTAGLVVACRPAQPGHPLAAVVSRLEESRAAVLLGHVTAGDVRAARPDLAYPDGCLDDLVARCGGVAWLVAEALALHPDGLCPGHGDVDLALQDVVLHRVASVPPHVRAHVDAGAEHDSRGDAETAADLLRAEGLAGRSGALAPVVRDAVRARTAGLHIDGDSAARALRRAVGAWDRADLDGAGAALDPLPGAPGSIEHARGAVIAASVWAARGLPGTGRAVFRAALPESASPFALLAAVAAGDPPATEPSRSTAAPVSVPTALTVSLELLDRGLRTSLAPDSAGALHDLVRAAEMYSAAGAADPVPELPAVVAALAAIGLGELDVAGRVLDDALAAGHGGPWAHEHLLLWSAWVALHARRPREVEAVLEAVAAPSRPLDPRDRLLLDALRVGLARRHSDETGLRVAWGQAAPSVLHAEPDVLAALPLGELAAAGARLGATGRIDTVLSSTRDLVARLGAPPVWSAHLAWAGIQQGILSNSPAALTPHARALVAAAPHSRVCATMARAGRVWTEILAGDVDAEAAETSALELAGIGLGWDGARLASHGAARSTDRRAVARLLACARQLNPPAERSAPEADVADAPAGLSTREREVAVLVLQGLTYAEIGETIFISPRTAEHHIARIRQRLGATSRSDLIAKLRRALDERAPRRESA